MSLFERQYAEVTNINDPEKRGRIKVKCDAILAADLELPDWIEPKFPYVAKGGFGWFLIPGVGSMVEIEFPEPSKYDETAAEEQLRMNDWRWRCTAYNDVQLIPKVFVDGYPTRGGIVFPGGWVFYADWGTSEPGFFLGYMADGETPTDWIKIQGKLIEAMTEDGMQLRLAADKVTLKANNKDVDIEGSGINVGGAAATEALSLGDKVVTYLTSHHTWDLAHVHTSAAPGSPTSSPTVPPPDVPTDLTSTKHKVEP